MSRLTFWGVRGSTPTPVAANMGYGGNTPCLELRMPGHDPFIFDAGSGVRPLGTALMEEYAASPVMRLNIFLTHFHWDHIQGVPFFAPLYDARSQIRFLAHAPMRPLQEILEGQMSQPYFPVNFESATAKREFVELSDGVWSEGSVKIQPFALNHPQGSAGFRIETGDAVIVYATDHEHGNDPLDSSLREFAAGADLLIYDAQYTPEEFARHRGWGHSTWREAVSVARDAGAGQLILFHHEPGHDDATMDAIVAAAQQEFANTVGAREGMTVEF